MSTRGTYQFNSEDYNTTIYVHHDNYPTGAAAYFYDMLNNPSSGTLATQFIRAVPRATITKSHEYHGDTEFQYTVTELGVDPFIEAFSVNTKKVFFSGPLYDFVHRNSEHIENYKPFKLIKSNDYSARSAGKFLNVNTARLLLESEFGSLSSLRMWRDRYRGSSNWTHCQSEVRMIVEAFPELNTEEIEELLK